METHNITTLKYCALTLCTDVLESEGLLYLLLHSISVLSHGNILVLCYVQLN